MAVGSGEVDQFMAALEHPLKAEIERLRAIVIGANAGISEQIKWKVPSFCYRGDDRVTTKLHPVSQVQLIFHRGARPKDTTNFAFENSSSLLKWAAMDRGVATFRDMPEINRHEAALTDLVNRWMIATSE